MDSLLCPLTEQIWLPSSCSVQRVHLTLMGVYFYRRSHGVISYTFLMQDMHSRAPTQARLAPPLTATGLSLASRLLQLFREFLQTSLLRFLIAPDDTLLIFSLLLFSQESDCSSFPVWWFIGTAEVPVRARLGEPYETSVVQRRCLRPRFVFLLNVLGVSRLHVWFFSRCFFGWRATTFPV